jgi:spoIIIJ-associated protein
LKQVEKSARTIEEAVSLALRELGASRDHVTVEVLEEPSKGFFGIGSRQATVLVRYLEPTAPIEMPKLENITAEAPASARPADTGRSNAATVVRDVDKPQQLKELVEQICATMGLKARVAVKVENDRLLVDITGDNAGMLIGHHGQTLDALQLILNLAANKLKDDGMRVLLDVEGYRKRREEILVRLAASKAEQVRRTGRKVLLEPMSAQERRIVHLALQDHPHVLTESEGEEPFRRVVILPKY